MKLVHNYWKNNIDRYATDYWACSELAGEFFYKKSILESDNYRIINNAIEVKKYCRNTKIRDKVRTELGIGNNDIVVGHVGRFQYQKITNCLLIYIIHFIRNILTADCFLLDRVLKKRQ